MSRKPSTLSAAPVNEQKVGTPPTPATAPARPGFWSWRRWPLKIALLLALLVCLGLGSKNWYGYLRASQYYRAAEKALAHRDYRQAQALARLAQEAWPNDPQTAFLLARIERQAGLFQSAEDQLDACQRLEGISERLRLERSLLLVQQGAITASSEAQLQEYLRRNHPETNQILEALGRGCIATYRLPDSLRYLDQLLERKPDDAKVYRWRSAVYLRLLDFDAAKKDCRRAAALDPNDPDTQVELAEVLFEGEETNEAAALFKSLHEQFPDNPRIAIGLGRALMKLGRQEEAEKLLDVLARKYPYDAPVLLERGKVVLDNPAAAEPWLRRAAERAPGDYQAQYTLFLCLQRKGDEAGAREVKKKVDQLSAGRKLMSDFSEQLKRNPYDLQVRCDLAKLFLDQGDQKEGVRWLKEALKMDPTHRLANKLLADYYEQSGQPGLAAPYRQRANEAQ